MSNVSFITLRLGIDTYDFEYLYYSHPDYPSMLALYDTLKHFNVESEALKVDKEFWPEFRGSFISIYENSYVIGEKKDFLRLYSPKYSKIDKEDFLNEGAEAILILKDKTITPFVFRQKYFLYLYFILIFFIAILHNNIYLSFYMLSICLGLFLSIEILKQKKGSQSALINKICTNKVESADSSCNKLFNNESIKIGNLMFSDLCFIYFLIISVFFIFVNQFSFYLIFLSYISLLAVCLSLFIQFFIEKTICKVCMLINLLLLIQFVLASHFLFNFSLINFISCSLGSLGIIIFANFYKGNTILLDKIKFENIQNFKFKRRYSSFKSLLLNNKKYGFEKETPFLFGEKDSRVIVDIITSANCIHCVDVMREVQTFHNSYHNILFKLRFNIDSNSEENAVLFKALMFLYDKNRNNVFSVLQQWHVTKDLKSILEDFTIPMEAIESIDINSILDVSNENRNNNLTWTPCILLNGFQFPEQYKLSELKLFIEDMSNEHL